MHVLLVPGSGHDPTLTMHDVDPRGAVVHSVEVATSSLPQVVREREVDRPRWVWADTATSYPPLLMAGVRLERCVDLRLSRAILRASPHLDGTPFADAPASAWDEPGPHSVPQRRSRDEPFAAVGLFDLEPAAPAALDPVEEFRAQQHALNQIRQTVGEQTARKLGFLLAAESAGALAAAEMTFAGVPWDVGVHDQLLTDALGPRPQPGHRPYMLELKLAEIQAALDAPTLNPDSAPDLLRALQHSGLPVRTTRTWELEQQTHPVIEPLLEFKKLSRLMAANGWSWIESWVRDGRFRPVYVPGGGVSGRWAADGGGALQLPHTVRSAVRADPGWKLVVADAAQLEPRILAAMSGDPAMARAGQGHDMYAGMVATGAVGTREEAKLGMLGAMYGGTQGESGRMLPRLTRAFPRAIELVEQAAHQGERGERVQTWLGRTSPAPSSDWVQSQETASSVDASPDQVQAARGQSRSWGRFTRNFVVQGTAAEWALTWIAILRNRLVGLVDEPNVPDSGGALDSAGGVPAARSTPETADGASAAALRSGPHLVFFLHDEIMIHAPVHLTSRVTELVEESAAEAGRLIFGAPDAGSVEFPVSVTVVDSYDQAG